MVEFKIQPDHLQLIAGISQALPVVLPISSRSCGCCPLSLV
jgi:hypothetical protein